MKTSFFVQCLTKTAELHLQKKQVLYVKSANDNTQFSNKQEISNSHEEADTSIIHTLEQIKPVNCKVIVHATDTHVFFLLLKHCKVILQGCHHQGGAGGIQPPTPNNFVVATRSGIFR